MEILSSYSASTIKLGLAAAGTAAVVVFALRRIAKRKGSGLRVANYEKNMVYLFNFPSCRTIVSISPFGLKLETWLRMHQIRYTAIRKTYVWSRKGQIPFVELNGQEYNASNLIIAELQKYFGVDDGLSEQEQGLARGLEMMLENQTVFSYFYYRYVEAAREFVQTWEFSGFLLRWVLYRFFPPGFRHRLKHHGIGRNTVPEIYSMGFEDIRALSRVLGSKKFLFGERMTAADCYAFGHLAQILYVPVDYPHKQFMREQTPNLCEYVTRIKETLWPDWDQLCMDNLLGSNN
ncbi:hypothetical protein BOX15_Mlig023210g1 [Macrostomum lignano]|uniref:Uncharacterized protein n=1 Tax=Macrostomum lignano TaxID=282301 RepID=A0A267FED8_9PLAT|nr:hypothetical protein BOX15_Mlig023210g1 [Macrostomum lignano]